LSGARIFVLLSQLLVLPIVARHLDVSDFGDMALAMTVVVFTHLLSDAGMVRSLIRRDRYDPAEWSSVFWFLVAVGIALTALLVAAAPVWSWAFDRPTLGPLVAALSVIPFLLALSAVPTARMERAHRFPALAAIAAASALAGLTTAVSLAVLGAGAWALVGQQIAIAGVQCCAALALSGFRPHSPRVRVPLGDHLVFARNSIGVSFLLTARQQVPMMMIGYGLGAVTLGLFSMSQRVLNLPGLALAGPASRIIFVRMSEVQRDPGRAGAIYIASIRLLALAIFPPMAVLAGVGDTAFALLLSDPWRPAAVIFALAAPGIALEASTSSAGVLLQAFNRTGLRLRMSLERTLLRLTVLALALPFGIDAMAAAISISALCYLPRVWEFVGRVVDFDRRAALVALGAPVGISGLLWAGCRWLQAESSGWLTLVLAGALLLAVWIPAILVMHRPALATLTD
jgi:O-antigen/teichoic acid export membrane protein